MFSRQTPSINCRAAWFVVSVHFASVALPSVTGAADGAADWAATGADRSSANRIWIIGFIVLTGGPILFSIIISFCDYDILNPARFVGLTNYRWMFSRDPLFWKSIRNTAFMVIGIPLGMALSLGIALLLNLEIRGVAVWRTFFYLPSIVPAVASSILWLWILSPNAGLLNAFLASFGIHGPNWLENEQTSKPALILMGLWAAGGGMIIWLAGLKGISATYYEAAALDGASVWQRFRHITLPLLSPYIFFNLIMGLIATLQGRRKFRGRLYFGGMVELRFAQANCAQRRALLGFDNEGVRVAEWLNSKGIAAFVLKYRTLQASPAGRGAGSRADALDISRKRSRGVQQPGHDRGGDVQFECGQSAAGAVYCF